jgi:hypothetical protein
MAMTQATAQTATLRRTIIASSGSKKNAVQISRSCVEIVTAALQHGDSPRGLMARIHGADSWRKNTTGAQWAPVAPTPATKL